MLTKRVAGVSVVLASLATTGTAVAAPVPATGEVVMESFGPAYATIRTDRPLTIDWPTANFEGSGKGFGVAFRRVGGDWTSLSYGQLDMRTERPTLGGHWATYASVSIVPGSPSGDYLVYFFNEAGQSLLDSPGKVTLRFQGLSGRTILEPEGRLPLHERVKLPTASRINADTEVVGDDYGPPAAGMGYQKLDLWWGLAGGGEFETCWYEKRAHHRADAFDRGCPGASESERTESTSGPFGGFDEGGPWAYDRSPAGYFGLGANVTTTSWAPTKRFGMRARWLEFGDAPGARSAAPRARGTTYIRRCYDDVCATRKVRAGAARPFG